MDYYVYDLDSHAEGKTKDEYCNANLRHTTNEQTNKLHITTHKSEDLGNDLRNYSGLNVTVVSSTYKAFGSFYYVT